MVTAERASETELAALRAENRALRQQVEEARRESQTREQREAHFQLADRIVSTVRNLVLVANERVEVTFASPSVYRLLGYTPEEVLGEGWLNLTRKDPEERQRVKHYLSAAARGEVEISATPYERQMYDKQGSQRWVLWQDTRGPGNSIIGIGSDITARKQIEETLRESEERHRSIIAAALDAVVIMDTAGLITDWNLQAETIFGWSYQEAVGRSLVSTLIPLQYREAHERGLKHFLATGEGRILNRRIETVAVHRDGHEFPVELTVSPIRSQGTWIFSAFVRDITERKRMEEELRESEDRYRSLFEKAYDGIACFTVDGIHTSVNRGLEAMTGWSREDMIGHHFSEFITPASAAHAQERARRIQAGERVPSVYEIEIIHKEGYIVPIEGRTRLIRSTSGTPLEVLGIYRDITERKRVEEALQKAKEAAEAANRAKSEFLATMSHELRTPLGIILGYTELLLEDIFGPLGEEQLGPLRVIDRNARGLLDLITAVLDLSRLEAGRLPLSLRETQMEGLLQDLQAETYYLQEQARLTFVWEVEPTLPVLCTDPGKLKIVLKNLIGNAVKFTPQGSITVAARRCKDGVEFSVADTGIGIPQEALELIFEPFRQIEHSATHQYGGTGLGLHIVKRLLDLLGGTVTVESAVGCGTTFRVWIPQN